MRCLDKPHQIVKLAYIGFYSPVRRTFWRKTVVDLPFSHGSFLRRAVNTVSCPLTNEFGRAKSKVPCQNNYYLRGFDVIKFLISVKFPMNLYEETL